jgi:AcrR family transcriptional regulator
VSGSISQTRRAADGRSEQILEAAARAIARLGFDSTRIADVAREAGVSTGTVHYHFDTRDDVLLAALTWANERAYETLDDALDGDDSATAELGRLVKLAVPWPGVARDWWLLWFELWRRLPHHPHLREGAEQLAERWRRYYLDVVARGTAGGEFDPPGGDPVQAAETLIALTDGLASQALVELRSMPPERMLEITLRFAAEQLRVDHAVLARTARATPVP